MGLTSVRVNSSYAAVSPAGPAPMMIAFRLTAATENKAQRRALRFQEIRTSSVSNLAPRDHRETGCIGRQIQSASVVLDSIAAAAGPIQCRRAQLSKEIRLGWVRGVTRLRSRRASAVVANVGHDDCAVELTVAATICDDLPRANRHHNAVKAEVAAVGKRARH